MRISVICGSWGWCEDEALVFEAAGAEVDQERSGEARGLQIVDDLSVFVCGEPAEGLDFDDQAFVADEVGALRAVESVALVVDGEGDFAVVGDVPSSELTRQGLLVDRF